MEMLLIPILLVVMVVVINLANGNLGSVAFGVHTDDQHLDDDDEAEHTHMLNISGSPMCGSVDCDGNPFGADDGLDYGFDDSGSMFDD